MKTNSSKTTAKKETAITKVNATKTAKETVTKKDIAVMPEALQEAVQTKTVVKEKKSKMLKFEHTAKILNISAEELVLIKNYMLFNLASKKSKTTFIEYAIDILYKYSMDADFKQKVTENYF